MKTQFSIHIFGFFLVCILSFHPSFAIQDYPLPKFRVDSLKQKEEKYWYADKSLEEMTNKPKKEKPKQAKSDSGWSMSATTAAMIGAIFKFLIWLILGAAVVGAIYLIFTNLKGYKFNTNPKVDAQAVEVMDFEEPKDIENIDFEKQITACLKNQNYRLATRYYYLWIVKILDESNLIDFNIDKTNQDYLRELSQKTAFSSEKLSHFRKCTNYYEYLWFGNFEVSEPIFVRIENTFKEFIYRKA
ncbi:MAG: hypothetical protein MUF45_13450 [Spirosomaceae bacterium]|nr:hypothetical protein [Spirosomataceae bacterium]